MALTREEILAADDLPTWTLAVPEWGGEVRMRALNGAQYEEVELRLHRFKSSPTGEGWRGMKLLVARYSMVSESGDPLFDTKTIDQLSTKNAAALERVFKSAMAGNGMLKEDVEKLEKN